MKANRINLTTEVREALVEAGYSTVKVVNAVNSDLESKLTCGSTESKSGDGKLADKGSSYKVTVTGTFKYEGKLTMPLLFDAWHSTVEKMQKVATTKVSIPSVFINWLDKFAKKEADAPAPEKEKEKEQEQEV